MTDAVGLKEKIRRSSGRFFANVMMKAMLAHIVSKYDITLEEKGIIPSPMWAGTAFLPSRTGKVLCRRRRL